MVACCLAGWNRQGLPQGWPVVRARWPGPVVLRCSYFGLDGNLDSLAGQSPQPGNCRFGLDLLGVEFTHEIHPRTVAPHEFRIVIMRSAPHKAFKPLSAEHRVPRWPWACRRHCFQQRSALLVGSFQFPRRGTFFRLVGRLRRGRGRWGGRQAFGWRRWRVTRRGRAVHRGGRRFVGERGGSLLLLGRSFHFSLDSGSYLQPCSICAALAASSTPPTLRTVWLAISAACISRAAASCWASS